MKIKSMLLLNVMLISLFMPFGETFFGAETNTQLADTDQVIEDETVTKKINKNEISIDESVVEYKEYISTKKTSKTSFSSYVNQDKEDSDAGLKRIEINTGDQVLYLNQNGKLSKTKSANSLNEIEIKDKQIISTDKGIVETLGGYEREIDFYNSLEEADSGENPIKISGGAFDGEYVATHEFNGNTYVEMLISGLDAFVAIDDVQIIPSAMVNAQSHYQNIKGVWYYFEAIDPLVSDEYKSYPISNAPTWAEENITYFSTDQETFTENQFGTKSAKELRANSYYQNLPFTSTANYSAANYKSYLAYKGKQNSKYYNATDGFIQAQEKESINSLILFAMANHEGAYGTSNLSNKCNNFFGWGAYDSNPANACKEFSYSTPKDGILAQSLHLTQRFADIDDWRFGGTEVGNKSHGINVKYASDPNWGASISSQIYAIDKYLGLKEYNKYQIYEIKNSEPTYKDEKLKSKLKIDGSPDKDYVLPRKNGNPRVIVTNDKSNSFEYQLPTPINLSSTTTCSFSDAKIGKYSSYEKLYSVKNIDKGVASFACQYSSFSNQRAWYPKKDAKGSITFNKITNNTITKPGTPAPTGACNKFLEEKIINGDKVKYYGSSDSKNTCKVVYYGTSSTRKEYYKYYTNSSGKRTKRIIEKYNKSATKTYYANTNYSTSTGKITNYKEYFYNSSGKRVQRNEKVYYSNGKAKQMTKFYYTPTYLKRREIYKYDTSGRKTYYANTNYSTSTKKITDYKEYFYNTSGKRIQRNEKVYYSNGKSKQLKKFYYYDNGKLKTVKTYNY